MRSLSRLRGRLAARCLGRAAPTSASKSPRLLMQKLLKSFGDRHAPIEAFVVLAKRCATSHS